MTEPIESVTLAGMNPRTKIQVDCDPAVRNLIRAAALQQGWSLREAVLYSLAKQFPVIKDQILEELSKE